MNVVESAPKAHAGRVPSPPARSHLLRLYGAVVPRRVRLRIKQRLSPRVASFLARRLTSAGPLAMLADQIGAVPARLRGGRFLRRPGYALARAGRRTVVARVMDAASAHAARQVNLHAVIDALSAAGVPYFRVRGFRSLTSVVAVPRPERAAALGALAAVGRTAPVYLAEVRQTQVGPMRPGTARRV